MNHQSFNGLMSLDCDVHKCFKGFCFIFSTLQMRQEGYRGLLQLANLPSPMWHKALVGFSLAEGTSVMEITLGIFHNVFKMATFLLSLQPYIPLPET